MTFFNADHIFEYSVIIVDLLDLLDLFGR